MKIRNKLFYVSGGLYGQLGNVYAVRHAEGYFLIDCGTPAAYDTILDNLHCGALPSSAQYSSMETILSSLIFIKDVT